MLIKSPQFEIDISNNYMMYFTKLSVSIQSMVKYMNDIAKTSDNIHYRLIKQNVHEKYDPGVSHMWTYYDHEFNTLIGIKLFKDGMIQCHCTNGKEHSFHECSSLAGRRTMLITINDFYFWFISGFIKKGRNP